MSVEVNDKNRIKMTTTSLNNSCNSSTSKPTSSVVLPVVDPNGEVENEQPKTRQLRVKLTKTDDRSLNSRRSSVLSMLSTMNPDQFLNIHRRPMVHHHEDQKRSMVEEMLGRKSIMKDYLINKINKMFIFSSFSL